MTPNIKARVDTKIMMDDINKLTNIVGSVIEGEIIEDVLEVQSLDDMLSEEVAPVEHSRAEPPSLESSPVRLEGSIDSRDELDEYEEGGFMFLSCSTLNIFPVRPEEPVRSPNDTRFLKKSIYDNAGQINPVLREMNWHPACKAELLRWIKKNNLSDDMLLARETIIDEAEEVVRESVGARDVETAKFVLKTAGKKRGWTEKEGILIEREIYAIPGISGQQVGDLKKLSNAELTAMLEDKLRS